VPDTISHNEFDRTLFPHHYRAEDRHFWFVARNRIIAALCRQLYPSQGERFFALEAGCGTGDLLPRLTRCWPKALLVGMDLHPEALAYARRRANGPLLQANIHDSPFREVFDFVGMFDVLEHLPDDVAILQQVRSTLKPGGRVVVSVPACPSLWSYCDKANRHRRRYSVAMLRDKLAQAGFRVEYISPFMCFLFPLIWVKRNRLANALRGSRKDPGEPVEQLLKDLKIRPILNGLLTHLGCIEIPIIKRRLRLPFGTSLVAIGNKDEAAT
jgi:SAM-dependent methyltransferase